jgi:Cytidylate kinase-like family
MSVSLLDNFSHYLQAQASCQENDRAVRPLALTISRKAGAGAATVAELVLQRLTAAATEPSSSLWAVFDAHLAKQVLMDHKLSPGLSPFMAEDARLPVEAIVEEILGLHPSDWALVQHTAQTIERLAGFGRTILVGRGGNIITARLPNVFQVRLVAPLLTRFRHSVEYYHLTEAEAAKLVRGQDRARRCYLRRDFNAKIDEPTLYDVTPNTAGMGFVRAPEVIAEAGLRHHQAFAEREGSLKVSVE